LKVFKLPTYQEWYEWKEWSKKDFYYDQIQKQFESFNILINSMNPEEKIIENFNKFKEKYTKNQMIFDTNKKLIFLTLDFLLKD
jgi:squalene cyclase